MGNKFSSFDEWIDKTGLEQIAIKLGVKRITVWYWRSHRGYPKIDHMRAIRRLTKGAVTYEMMIDRRLVKGV